MRTYLGWLLAAVALPLTAYAQEATVNEVHDTPAVRGSIIANLLQEHDNPFTLYPYDTNYLLYTWTSDINKEAIKSYNWSDNARKDEVKYQLSLAFPFWRGILGPNSVLGASYTQKSWWQLSNSGESSPFRETNYEPQLFLGLQRITSLQAGRCATWRWALTTTPMAAPTPLHAAGTVFIPA
jgi:phospholipase A1